MAIQRLDVFLSSTSLDLKKEREAARSAILDLGYHPVGMEDYSAMNRAAVEKCLADVRACDVYLLVVAWSYGHVPQGHKHSITELEYREAARTGKPRLIFVLREGARWDPAQIDENRDAVRAFRQKLMRERVVSFWETESDLKQQITAALFNLVAEGAEPAPGEPPKSERAAPRAAPSRLPSTGELLIGRGEQLRLLSRAWATLGRKRKTNVVQIVAPGGVGKTQLVKKWRERLAAEGFRGAEQVFDWSFYSQGSSDQAATADLFVDAALRWFGEEDPTRLSGPWDKGEQLASLVGKSRSLILLDGLEPLQHPPGPLEGKLRDPALRAFLQGLAEGNAGLCVVTTREPVAELRHYSAPACQSIDLSELEPQDGAELLRAYGVVGPEEDLQQAARDCGGHALALILLATHLRDRFGGDVGRRSSAVMLRGREHVAHHARRVMASYESWLEADATDAVSRAAVTILRLMGLFNRPADVGCLEALCRKPIKGLSEALFDWMPSKGIAGLLGLGGWVRNGERWDKAVGRLRSARLLADASHAASSAEAGEPQPLDCHPLVREHFAEQLSDRFAAASREAHRRLYEHLTRTVPDLPDNLPDLMPLYHAVAHACACGRHLEAFVDTYLTRIRRDEHEHQLTKLGLFSTDLAAVSLLLDQTWEQFSIGGMLKRKWTRIFRNPWYLWDWIKAFAANCLKARSFFSVTAKAWLLSARGVRLCAVGRSSEAVEPMRAGIRLFMQSGRWRQAAVRAGELAEILLVLGKVPEALEMARESVAPAFRKSDLNLRRNLVANLANVLHAAGRRDAAASAYAAAEAMVTAVSEGKSPYLYRGLGFYHCDFRLSEVEMIDLRAALDPEGPGSCATSMEEALAQCEFVRGRARHSMVVMEKNPWRSNLLNVGLDQLTLSRSWRCEAGIRKRLADERIDQVGDGCESIVADALHEAEAHANACVTKLRASGAEHELPRGLLARAAFWRVKAAITAEPGREVEMSEMHVQAERNLAEAESIAVRGTMLTHRIEVALERTKLALAQGRTDLARDWLAEAKTLVRETEAPCPPLKIDKKWEPPDYLGTAAEGEVVGYHRRCAEIALLEESLGIGDNA